LRRAILTGGSSGIGAATCRALLEAGYEVINVSRRAAAFEHPRLISSAVDLTDPQATREALFALAAERPATTIVHCAGVIREAPVEDATLADLDALAHLHLGAALSLLQANLPAMKAERYGRVVLMSTRAIVGLVKRTVYASTKAGMVGMARTWALELAPHGITVNVVAPGPIADTGMFNEVVPPGSEKLARTERSVPVGRVGRPDDVSRAVLFFVSPEASFVTGQTLFVCGGASVGSMSF
jgi:NAD(P)-dependent dehydrogenase (short-subunit alcohol dehydrogenase family)